MDLLDGRFQLTDTVESKGLRICCAKTRSGKSAVVYSIDGGVTDAILKDFAEHHDQFMQSYPHHMGRTLLIVYDLRKLQATGFNNQFEPYVSCCKRNMDLYLRCVLCVMVVAENDTSAFVIQTILDTMFRPSRPTKVISGTHCVRDTTAQLWARNSTS